MANALIGFKGFDATIVTYELTQIGPIDPNSGTGPAMSVVDVIPAGQNTFTFDAPTVPGTYTYSVQAYDVNHAAVAGPQSATVNVTAPPADNVPAALTVDLAPPVVSSLGVAPNVTSAAGGAVAASAPAPHSMGY